MTTTGHQHAARTENALQELVREHCSAHNETLADVAVRAGLSRQTLSAIMNKSHGSGMPRADTLNKLAAGLRLSPRVVRDAASEAMIGTHPDDDLYDRRVVVLIDHARRMSPEHVDVLLATARALTALDTPSA